MRGTCTLLQEALRGPHQIKVNDTPLLCDRGRRTRNKKLWYFFPVLFLFPLGLFFPIFRDTATYQSLSPPRFVVSFSDWNCCAFSFLPFQLAPVTLFAYVGFVFAPFPPPPQCLALLPPLLHFAPSISPTLSLLVDYSALIST